MAGIKKSTVTDVFNGQSLIVLFNGPSDGYTSDTTFAAVTAIGVDLGQVVEDSTSWDGDDPTIDVIKDEQGDPIVSTITAGTYAFSFECVNFAATGSNALFSLLGMRLLGASSLSSDSINVVDYGFKTYRSPVTTRPIAIFNDESNKWLLFPKAKIVASMRLENGLWRVKISATAEFIDTAELGTVMIGKGSPSFL